MDESQGNDFDDADGVFAETSLQEGQNMMPEPPVHSGIEDQMAHGAMQQVVNQHVVNQQVVSPMNNVIVDSGYRMNQLS